jgi:hypothetical protein
VRKGTPEAPGLEGVVVEAVEQRLVDDRAAAHGLGAQQPEVGVLGELDTAAPVQQRVGVDLGARVRGAREVAPGFEHHALQTRPRERVADERAGDPGPHNHSVVHHWIGSPPRTPRSASHVDTNVLVFLVLLVVNSV